MAGYTRQSVADIIANAVIKAAPVNAEFNAIRDAFNNSTGHKHDGTSAEGTYVPLIADLDGQNKVVVDTVNNRISVYTEVSGSAVEQLRIQDGAIVPVTDDDVDLGAAGAEFKDLYIDGIGYLDTVVVTGGTIDNTIIGGTTPAAGSFTSAQTTGNTTVGGNLSVTGTTQLTGTTTINTVDINAGSIDNTVIGASAATSANFTTIIASGHSTLPSVNIDSGTIDGTIIGAATPTSANFTIANASGGFVGDVTGNLTGNVTGNVTGDLTGDVTGDLTGNVTASTGTSSFSDVTINGTLNMNAGTTATITNLTDPTNAQDAATKSYVDTGLASLVDSAPGALDTLNELAAALGDDADFSTTVTSSIATKLPLAGGTMSGDVAMGTNSITGMADPVANQDATTKAYVDTKDATKLNLTGGTMLGAISMGANKVTATYTPSVNIDLTNKAYVDSILGSAEDLSDAVEAAAQSASDANTDAGFASGSAQAAAQSATDAATAYDDFDDRYLGAKSSAPTTDNDNEPLLTGALYYNSTANELFVWSGSSWTQAAFSAGSYLVATNNLSDLTNTATARQNLNVDEAGTALALAIA